jgi:competence protein ComEC
VAIVLAGVLWPMRRRAVDRRVQALVVVGALAALVVLVRPRPSVLRAAAMGLVSLAGLAAGRPRAAVPALSAAVAVLVLARPALAGDAGFSLSVAATAGIVLLAVGRAGPQRYAALLVQAGSAHDPWSWVRAPAPPLLGLVDAR